MAREHLPGLPPPKLIREVRRSLAVDGIRPTWSTLWAATWQWASAIRLSYVYPRWPMPSEIATQYIVLLLAQRKESCTLRLPARAAEKAPPAVLAILAKAKGLTLPGLEPKHDEPAAPKALPAHQPNPLEVA